MGRSSVERPNISVMRSVFVVFSATNSRISDLERQDFLHRRGSKRYRVEAATYGWQAVQRVELMVCGIQQTSAPPLPGWQTYRRQTTSVSGWPLQVRPTWLFTPAHRLIMFAVFSVQITALSLTIVVQRTTGISHQAQYNTVGPQILHSNTSTASTITYTFTLATGQTLGTGTNRLFAAQTKGTGTVHPFSGDTFTVTYTTGGITFTQTGHF